MRKTKESLIISIIMICLLVCILAFNVIYKKVNNKLDCNFKLDDILLEINLETGNKFFSEEEDIIYMPVELDRNINYLFAVNRDLINEYFIVIEDLDSVKLEEMKDYIKNYSEKTIINTYGKYTYVISSDNHESVIDGIIRSYIFCN